MHRKATITILSALALATSAGLLVAGPLSPPAGPVASTYKTLTEVEPRIAINATNTPGDADSVFRITQPGSYYLTGNVSSVSGKKGIEIAASNVTIDLSGFTMTVSATSLSAITSSTGNAVTVRNGQVEGPYPGFAFILTGPSVVEDVTMRGVTGGISISGGTSTVRRCSVTGIGTLIDLAGGGTDVQGSLIEECQIVGTGTNQTGIALDHPGSTIRNCNLSATVSTNTSVGIINATQVFGAHNGYVIDNCNIRDWSWGISTQSVTIRRCSIVECEKGIFAGLYSVIEENRIARCGVGVELLINSAATVVRNSFSANGAHCTGQTGNGIGPFIIPSQATNPQSNIIY